MIFPNTITIAVLNNSKKISGLVCSVRLLTFHKNNYSIGMFKTNNEGEFVITKEKIEKEIKESNEIFIMDYDSSPDNFKGSIEIVIENIEDINRRMSAIEKFFPERIKEMKRILEGNINNMITTTFSEIAHIQNFIKIIIK